MNAKKRTSQQPVDTSRGRAGRPKSIFAPVGEGATVQSDVDGSSSGGSSSDGSSSGGSSSDGSSSGEPELVAPEPVESQITAEKPTIEQSTPTGIAAIEATDLTRSYGDSMVLEPLSLHIPVGQRVALVGHNGSGKTTLIRMITGTLDPTGGTVTLGGHAVGSIEARAAMSYLADQPVFYDDLSLIEHIEYVARLHGREQWLDHANELAERFGIAHRRDDLPVTFSRGLKQKAAICLAFIRPFEVLIVDEPFVGLDTPGRTELLALFDEAQRNGKSLLVATHELHTVAASDRLLALANGELIHDGSPDVDVETLVEGVKA